VVAEGALGYPEAAIAGVADLDHGRDRKAGAGEPAHDLVLAEVLDVAAEADDGLPPVKRQGVGARRPAGAERLERGGAGTEAMRDQARGAMDAMVALTRRGGRKARYRGTLKIEPQWLWVAAAVNLRRIAKRLMPRGGAAPAQALG
jgi:IS5 family transposase